MKLHHALALLHVIPAATITSVIPMSGALAAQGTDEITVTARRKEESVQDVPMSVLPIGMELIQDRGIKDINAVVSLDPSLVIDTGFSAEDVRIGVRGIPNSRGRSNVAFLVDGVDVTSESVQTNGASLLISQRLLTDIERIEVIKGPQSALYGRSAFAGAISYITRNANLENVEYNYGLELADYNRYQVSAGISGPVGPDNLGLRFQAVNWDGDSFYDNAASGGNFGGPKGWASALTLNYEPSDDFKLKWRLSYSDEEVGPSPQFIFGPDEQIEIPIPAQAFQILDPDTNEQIGGGPVEPGTQTFSIRSYGDANGRQASASENPATNAPYRGSQLELLRSSLSFERRLGPGRLSSITGYTDADLFIEQDIDYQARGFPDTILNNWEANTKNRTTQFSQELRYATELQGPLNYTVGLLGWRERRLLLDANYIAVCGPFGRNPNSNEPCASEGWQGLARLVDVDYGDNGFTDAKTTHWSLYGLAEWVITERLTFSAEARYVEEHFDLGRNLDTPCTLTALPDPFTPSCAPVTPISTAIRSDFVTPRFALEFALNDDTLLYASVASGRKPEGITTFVAGSNVSIESLSFDAEKLWAYEAGWKTTFDGRYGQLTLNGAVFFQDYTDKQVAVTRIATITNPVPPPAELTTTVPSVENAAAASVLGEEIQLAWQLPADGLELSFGYTHLDTEYKDYKSLSQGANTIASVGNCNPKAIIEGTDDEPTYYCEVDYSGNELEKSPEHTIASTFSVKRPLGQTGFHYLAEFDVNYVSDRFSFSDNAIVIESNTIANLRLGIQNDNWSIIAFANNLFDDDTITSGGTAAPDFGERFRIPPDIVVSSQLPDPRLVGIRVNYNFGG